MFVSPTYDFADGLLLHPASLHPSQSNYAVVGGAWGEHHWHSWAAIAKERYYILNRGHDTNYTGASCRRSKLYVVKLALLIFAGCGNTVSANDPMTCEWIVDCLCHSVCVASRYIRQHSWKSRRCPSMHMTCTM